MKKFTFRAKNWEGEGIKGVVEAADTKSAIELLHQRKLIVLSLKEQKAGVFNRLQSFLSRVTLADLAAFARQLATMVNAGLTISEALDLIQRQTTGKLKPILKEVVEAIKEGESLHKILGRYPKVFNKVFVASIKAGEEAGVLNEVLEQLATNLEQKKEFLGRVKGAMIYPIIVILGMIGVMIVMVVFVLPKMTALYKEFGTNLPLPTRILIKITQFSSLYFWSLPVLGVGVFGSYWLVNNQPRLRYRWDNWKLNAPILGPLLTTIALTDLSRTLGMMLSTGVSLVESLKTVAGITNNLVYQKAIKTAAQKVQKGWSLAKALEETQVFPPIFVQMVATGEQTGKLDEVLLKLAHYFDVQAQQALKNLTSAIEPLIMIVLGIGVGFLVIAIILPIYNITSQF